MSVPHHESGKPRNLYEMFAAQAAGKYPREYPSGRLDEDDEGALAFMIATDDRHRVIRIRFPKPVQEIGLTVEAAENIRDELTERIQALRGIV